MTTKMRRGMGAPGRRVLGLLPLAALALVAGLAHSAAGQATVLIVRDDGIASTPSDQPQDPTYRTDARFLFESTGFRKTLPYECSLDGAAFTSCSSPYEIDGPLADGAHSFRVRVSGNAPSEHTWTIDTTPPVASWRSVPPGIIPVGATATVVIDASEPVQFLCRLDDDYDYAPCTDTGQWSNTTTAQYAQVPEGSHNLRVVAVDRAGSHSNTLLTEFSADNCVLDPGLCKHNNMTALNMVGSCGPGFFLDLTDRNICRACIAVPSCSQSQLHCTMRSKYNSLCGTCTSYFSANHTNNHVDCDVVTIFPSASP